jgi:hypothetical protein
MTEEPPKECRIEVSKGKESVEATPQQPPTQPIGPELKNSKTEDTQRTVTPLKQVYQWAASGVSESITSNETDKFYPTTVYKAIGFKLKNTDSGLSLVYGLQGTGKSRILRQLANEGTYLFKWSKNWKDEIWQRRYCASQYYGTVSFEYEDQVNAYGRSGQSQKVYKIGDPSTILQRREISLMEAFLGKSKCNELREKAIAYFLDSIRIFLIDMPDYSRSNTNALIHDIAEIQRFWESLGYKGDKHLVIAIQKELVTKAPNFFWGKCDRYTVEPLTTEQLIEAFKLSNPEGDIFDFEALQLLGQLSRGVFRRFKKYMRLTIEADHKTLPITKDKVEKAITDDIVFQDLDQELADLFDDEEKRRCASKVLSYLRSHNEVNVKTIAEDIGVSESMAQKIVQKLALYNYITTKHGEGKEKLVSLQL